MSRRYISKVPVLLPLYEVLLLTCWKQRQDFLLDLPTEMQIIFLHQPII
ncbi:hypothetical protein EVA_20600 [gut metagenome]|uniref:Uncharacterized protein n=1 Tax=gut metagenome TaxID=749906 RepID=J9FVA0_9ZZZZ